MSKIRKKLVVWSGGMDSTLLLHQQAKENESEDPVEAFSFKVGFLDENKTRKEEQCRRNYLGFAQKQKLKIVHNIININSVQISEGGFPQQKSWFSFILPYIPDNCDVYFGYIQGDCIWLAVSDFYKIFDEFKYVGGCENSKLYFPFAFKEKWKILKESREAGIPENCFWTCEFPKKRGRGLVPCGKCHPCVTLEMAKKELRYRKKYAIDKV